MIDAAITAYNTMNGLYIPGGDYSVTDLITPPRIVHLRNRHKHELPVPTVEDSLAAFLGNAIHSYVDKMLRKANTMPQYYNQFMSEVKFWDKIGGRKIAGKIDHYHEPTSTLSDLKMCKVYKLMKGEFGDWEEQLNIYRAFLLDAGFTVDNLVIIAWNLDWNRMECERDPKYPPFNYTEVPITVWKKETADHLIESRVVTLRDSESAHDFNLPECSSLDMWEQPTKYRIMEPGKTRATRLVYTEEAVEEYVQWRANNGKTLKDYTVEVTTGRRTRCEDYCKVNIFCSSYLQYKESMAKE